MGLSPCKGCYTNTNESVVAPNPSPSRYKVVSREVFKNSTLLVVYYEGCTNFEGIKCMVYEGDFTPVGDLDPHFSSIGVSPIARFKPTQEGLSKARLFAYNI